MAGEEGHSTRVDQLTEYVIQRRTRVALDEDRASGTTAPRTEQWEVLGRVTARGQDAAADIAAEEWPVEGEQVLLPIPARSFNKKGRRPVSKPAVESFEVT
jgi:hypothetical protein